MVCCDDAVREKLILLRRRELEGRGVGEKINPACGFLSGQKRTNQPHRKGVHDEIEDTVEINPVNSHGSTAIATATASSDRVSCLSFPLGSLSISFWIVIISWRARITYPAAVPLFFLLYLDPVQGITSHSHHSCLLLRARIHTR